MSPVRRTGRTAVVAAVATAAAGLVLGATAASAGSAAPVAPAEESQSVETCTYPIQKLKVGIRLTLRDKADNDVKRIKVRASNQDETGSFYRKNVKLRSIRIETHSVDGDAVSVGIWRRTVSPAYVDLDPAGTGAEIDKVVTTSKLRMPSGQIATAKCTVSIAD